VKNMILANKIINSAFFQNLKELVIDSKEALLAFEGIFVILLIVWQLLAMQGATASLDDNAAKSATQKYINKIKIIVIVGVIIICATALFTLILSYFK
jgi:succinate dehydrogenase hydrophobic anchor subunit